MINNALVAQLDLEHFRPKEGVAGSNPAEGVYYNNIFKGYKI